MFNRIWQGIKQVVALQHYLFIGLCAYFLFIFFVSTHTCQKCVLNESWAWAITKHVFDNKYYYNWATKGLIALCVLEALFGLYMAYQHIKQKSFYI